MMSFLITSLDFFKKQEPILQLTFLVSLILALLCLATFFVTITLRLWLLLEKRRTKSCHKIWQPVLVQCLIEMPPALPKLKRKHRHDFIMLWNYYFYSIKGSDRQKLIDLAKTLRIAVWLKRAMHGFLSKKKVMAILTLGNLREKSAEKLLVKIGFKKNPILAHLAFQALMQIDPEKHLPAFLNQLLKKEDWPLPQLVLILKEAGADLISKPLTAAIQTAPENLKPKLIPLLDLVHAEQALLAIKTFLEESKNPEILAATLNILKDPRCLPFAKTHLHHEAWFVRVQAARALGRFGAAQDDALLIPLLSDSDWWVRYRAAEAIAKLPQASSQKLEQIRNAQNNHFARDILTQVLAEGICP